MTAWEKRRDPTGDRLFDALIEATKPFVEAAAATSAATPPMHLTARITVCIPIVVDVVCEDESGHSRTWKSTGSGPVDETLAQAVGGFVTAGLDTLPSAKQSEVGQRLSAGAALAVVLYPQLGYANVVIACEGHEDELLCTLTVDAGNA